MHQGDSRLVWPTITWLGLVGAAFVVLSLIVGPKQHRRPSSTPRLKCLQDQPQTVNTDGCQTGSALQTKLGVERDLLVLAPRTLHESGYEFDNA